MLAEYGLIHEVFEASSYSSPEVCELRLRTLKDILLKGGLVRDFREGEWRSYFLQNEARWDKRAKELVRKLVNQKRLLPSPAILTELPVNEMDWCREALASKSREPLEEIIGSNLHAARFEEICSIDHLERISTRIEDSSTVRLERRIQSYLKHLSLVLKSSSLIMLIDPHLDPSRPNYSEFVQLVLAARRTDKPQPLIQIHRGCYAGSGPNRTFLKNEAIREAFSSMHHPLKAAGLTVEVFVWDGFHDRYLITDLVGVLMPNGFDVSRDIKAMTTWARMSREARTSVQREFDFPNNAFHQLLLKFTLGQ